MDKDFKYLQYDLAVKEGQKKKEQYEQFKERIAVFKDVNNYLEAIELSEKEFPFASGCSRFNVGEATCVVIKQDDLFRISVDAQEEFICYDFDNREEQD